MYFQGLAYEIYFETYIAFHNRKLLAEPNTTNSGDIMSNHFISILLDSGLVPLHAREYTGTAISKYGSLWKWWSITRSVNCGTKLEIYFACATTQSTLTFVLQQMSNELAMNDSGWLGWMHWKAINSSLSMVMASKYFMHHWLFGMRIPRWPVATLIQTIQ